jgi:predicted nucleic acid-binding protein
MILASGLLSREIVTDANLWLNLVLSAHPSHLPAQQLVSDCIASGVKFIAPAWWEAEADSALRGMVKGGLLTPDAAIEAQRVLDAAPVSVVYMPRVRALARQIADAAKRHEVYDATYVAPAEARGCVFWTADKRFYNTMQNEAKGAYRVRSVDTYAGEYAPTIPET